jgi:hypothetical protein
MFLQKKVSITLILVWIISFYAISQLNIKVGYIGGFTKAPVLNGAVTRFNDDFIKNNPDGNLDDALDQIKSLHGIEIGLRYRINRVGFEISWHNMSDKADVFGTLNNKSSFQDKWFTSLTEYALGIENYFGNFGYGASLGYRTARIKTDITGAPRKKRLVTNESGLASKFYLIFQYPGDKVGIAFKPYIQVPLKDLDISDFDQEINVQLNSSFQALKPQDERFFMYGISIVLYNGRQ